MSEQDYCADHCAIHHTDNRPPGATDDACNNSDLGYFCVNSTWLYDPTLPGADTDANGDCQRFWIRIGETCNVAEWIELQVAETITSTTPPVDGDDCCPAGTIWRDTSTGQSYISLGDCEWCLICQDEIISVQEISYSGIFEWGDTPPLADGNIPVVDQLNILPVSVTITNPSTTRSMNVWVHFSNASTDFSFNNIVWPPGFTCSYAVQPNYFQDALQLNNPTLDDALFTWSDLQTSSLELDYSQKPSYNTLVLAPGGTVTFSAYIDLRVQVPHNAGGGRILIGALAIHAFGVLI